MLIPRPLTPPPFFTVSVDVVITPSHLDSRQCGTGLQVSSGSLSLLSLTLFAPPPSFVDAAVFHLHHRQCDRLPMAFIAVDTASALPITQRGYRLPTSTSTVVDTLGYSHFLHRLQRSGRRPAPPLYLFLKLLSMYAEIY